MEVRIIPLKVKTPKLKVRKSDNYFTDRDGEIELCVRHARRALGMKPKNTYRLIAYVFPPKKKATKFVYDDEAEGFRDSDGKFYYVEDSVLDWLLEAFKLDDLDGSLLDGKPIWVRVKKVK